MIRTGVLFLLSVQAIDEEKKVPPRHPLQRLNTLTRFSREWCRENLTAKQANNWVGKFKRNAERMEIRFEKCGFFDPSVPNGGPNPNSTNRNRRSIDSDSQLRTLDDDGFGTRYDKADPAEGIKDITSGFKKWAQRYIADCKRQPERQERRFSEWRAKIKSLLNDDGGSGESEQTVSM